MISKRVFVAGIAILIAHALPAAEFALDQEIQSFADKLAAGVKESGRKKITVVDFTDLQGKPSEFGRSLANRLIVAIVNSRKGFSVMDRADVNKILAEHKLTLDGIVEPETAKKI